MSLTQPQRSIYRDRRINAMLQERTPEGTSDSPTAPADDLRKPHRNRSFRPSVLVIALATAGLCALAVFFVLFRHDTARVVTNVPVQAARPAPESVPNEVAKPAAQEAATAQPASPQTAPPAPTRVQFRLSRSNRAQTVGGMNVKLVSTNARRGICNLQVTAPNGRPSQYTVQANRQLKVQLDAGRSVSVLVTGISKSSISGSVTGS